MGRSRWHARTGKVTAKYADGNSITFEPTEGNFSIGEMNSTNTENIKVTNRTKHDGFVEGPDMVQDVSIDLQMPREVFTSITAKTLFDFLLRKGTFATATPVDSIIPGSWEFLLDCTNNAGLSGQIRLPLVEGGFTVTEGAEFNTISFTGRNHLAPVFT